MRIKNYIDEELYRGGPTEFGSYQASLWAVKYTAQREAKGQLLLSVSVPNVYPLASYRPRRGMPRTRMGPEWSPTPGGTPFRQ